MALRTTIVMTVLCATVLSSTVLSAAVLPVHPLGAPSAGGPFTGAPTTEVLSIASVSPWVDPDGQFQVRFQPATGVPSDARLRATIHENATTDSSTRVAVEEILDGEPTGRVLHSLTRAVSELGDPATGAALTIDIRSRRGDMDRVLLPNPGVHPVELELLDARGQSLWNQLVYLNRLPVERDDPEPDDPARPPLAVTLVLPIGSAASIGVDGAGTFSLEERSNLRSITELLLGAGDVPLTIAPRPNTLDGLMLSDEPWAERLLDVLSQSPSPYRFLSMPYVAVDTGGLVSSGASTELAHQIEVGRESVERVAEETVDTSTWTLDESVTRQSLATLARAGVRSMLVPATSLDLEDADIDERSVASDPVRLSGDSGIRALAFDGELSSRLAGSASEPAVRAHEIVTLLMGTWFDHPVGDGAGPAAAVVVTPAVDARVLEALQPSLTGGGPLRAGGDTPIVPPEDLDDDETVVGLVDRPPSDQRATVAAATDTRRILDAYRSMVGDADPELWARERINDQTLSAAIDNGHRLEMHLAVRDGIDGALAQIELPPPRRVVITSRDATIPLRFRNNLPWDVTLVLRARSARLEITDGDTRPVVLHPGENRIDLPVTVQAPGESLLRVELFSPTPGIELDGPDVPVRSTAISGVGAALSAVSALFLIGWWIRTARRRGRDAARQGRAHPSGRPGTDSLPSGG